MNILKGEILRKLRINAGLTQNELGEMVGLSGTAIMRYENNQREPKQEIVERLAKVLQVNPMELLPYDEWEEKYNPEQSITKELNEIEYIERKFGNRSYLLVGLYAALNDEGKEAAINQLMMMSYYPPYKDSE